jgi:transporter family protein
MLPVLLTGHCEPLTLHDHFFLMGKAVIVGLSWLFTYSAIAHMPLSISTTIRALAPLFTIMIAVGFLGERPQAMQWAGIAVCVCSYIGLSMAGRKEMGHFFSNGWVVAMLLGTILAACSGIYDKLILQRMNFEPLTVQVWFSIYMCAVQFLTTMITWYPTRKKTTPFQYRWSFFAVAALLIVADRCYFLAVSHPDALISVITVLRRSSVFISFLAGILIFKERKSKMKFVAMLGVVIGLCLISLGR